MNTLSKIFLTFSLLALFAGNAAAQCGGKTVYLQLPSDWGSDFYMYWSGSGQFIAISATKQGDWHIFDFPTNLIYDNIGTSNSLTFTNENSWQVDLHYNVFRINGINYNVTGQASANPFSCSAFSTSGTYIFEDPENPGRTKIVAGQSFTIYYTNQWLKSDGTPTTIELYTGSPIIPAIDSIVYEGKKLMLGTDYEFLYHNNIVISNAAKISIIGKDFYGKVLDFYITNTRSIASTRVSEIPSQFWNGNEIKPQIAITDYSGAVTLREGLDYTIKYINNIAPGTATIEITGIGIYAGSQRAVNFTIYPTLAMATISAIDAVTYNGAEHKPSITVTHNTQGLLTEGTDYIINYADNINAGTGQVHVTGIGKHIGNISRNFTINRAPFTIGITDWAYGEESNTPIYPTTPETPSLNYTGTTNSGVSYNSIMPPTEAGRYTITATFPINDNYSDQRTANFTINRAAGTCSVTMPSFIASGDPSVPVPASATNTGSVTYFYEGFDNDYSGTNIPANAGLYRVRATFAQVANYNQCVATGTLTIHTGDATFADVTWTPACNSKYTYDGTAKSPVPSAEGYALTLSSIPQTNAGTYTATAQIAGNVSLRNSTCQYTIEPKPVTVSWTPERKFIYNKMVQSPIPSIDEPNVELRVVNSYSAAGVYEGALAPFAQIVSANAGNYKLTNATIDKYEISKKPLTPYFAANWPNFSTNKSDTLWVPFEVFNDSTALHSILNTLIAYDGFATDTVSKQSDNATVLSRTPTIKFEYTSTLSKRVETTQKATAIIVTEDVTADNYTLVRPTIAIMATIEEDEDADKIFCRIGNSCVEFSTEVCTAVSGQIVESCDIKVACVIGSVCVTNIPIESCSLVGEVVESCNIQVPIMSHISYPISHAPSYYNLKGQPMGMQKPTTPGIYIEKVGKSARKILVK